VQDGAVLTGAVQDGAVLTGAVQDGAVLTGAVKHGTLRAPACRGETEMTGLSSMAVRSRRAKVLLYVFIGTCYALLSSLFVSRGSQVSNRNREAVLNIVRKKNFPEKYFKKETEKENSISIFPKYNFQNHLLFED
jgi:hypothetical protein